MATSPNWLTDDLFYGGPGSAGYDHTVQQNANTALMGDTPAYLAALAALGYTGGDPASQAPVAASQDGLPGPNPDTATFLNWLAQNGYQSKSYSSSDQGSGQQTSALFDANGNELTGTQRTYQPDVNEDAFEGAILAGGLFGGAAAAGVGAAGAGSSGLSSSDLGTIYGNAGYGSTGATGATGAASNAVNFVTDPAFAASGGTAATGATAGGLSSSDLASLYGSSGYGAAASPAELGAAGATGTAAAGSTGLFGTGITGSQALSGLGTAAKFATSPAGGALIGAAGGLLGNSSGLNSATQTQSKAIDPRLVPYIYGSNGTSGLLGNTANLYNQQMATGGLNANQTAGLNSQLAVLNDPSYSSGFNQMRTLGSGLLNQGVAGNPFTQAPTAYGGAPQSTPQISIPATNLSQIGKTTMPVYSGAPNRVSGLL